MEKQLNTNMDLLKIEEVAQILSVSTQTINNWYRFARLNPNNKYSKLLPKYFQASERQTRYWRMEDIVCLATFKDSIPKGRGGILGDVTQKHSRCKDKKTACISEIENTLKRHKIDQAQIVKIIDYINEIFKTLIEE